MFSQLFFITVTMASYLAGRIAQKVLTKSTTIISNALVQLLCDTVRLTVSAMLNLQSSKSQHVDVENLLTELDMGFRLPLIQTAVLRFANAAEIQPDIKDALQQLLLNVQLIHHHLTIIGGKVQHYNSKWFRSLRTLDITNERARLITLTALVKSRLEWFQLMISIGNDLAVYTSIPSDHCLSPSSHRFSFDAISSHSSPSPLALPSPSSSTSSKLLLMPTREPFDAAAPSKECKVDTLENAF